MFELIVLDVFFLPCDKYSALYVVIFYYFMQNGTHVFKKSQSIMNFLNFCTSLKNTINVEIT